MGERLLTIKDLSTHFFTHAGVVKAVNGVSFTLDRGETIGIVGESGSGKTVAAMSLMRLIPDPPGKVVEGSLMLGDKDLRTINDDEMRAVRGNDIAMIFQDPMTSLNPVMKIGKQIAEAIMLHQDKGKKRGVADGRGPARPRGHPGRRQARRPVPVRVLRRHAPAGDDRHGDQLQPRRPDRRRAHDGARRDHPGADHRRRARDAGPVRLRRHPHHPRPRGHRRDLRQGHGDVRRPHRRVRPRGRDLLQRPPPVHVGPAGVAAAARRVGEDAAHAHQGPAAEPHHAASRLPVHGALPVPRARSAATTGPSTRPSVRITACTAGSPWRSASTIRGELPQFKEPAA